MDPTTDPVFTEHGAWFFLDEAGEAYGPYNTEGEAYAMHGYYIDWLEHRVDEMDERFTERTVSVH